VVNYDSKRVIAINPGNFASDRGLITSNWPQITFKLLVLSLIRFIDPPQPST
jgi:hypothetical protein